MLDVYVDRRSNFIRRRDYILNRMLGGLQGVGLPWRILEHGDVKDPAAVAFVHVDLTELPAELLSVNSRYVSCINGKAATIDRRAYSRLRLMPDDSYDGPVIVKTVANSRGFPELRYAARRNLFSRLGHGARKLAVPGYKERHCPEYRVYGCVADVPAGVWGDERLLVERFAPGSLATPITRYKYNFFLDVEESTRATFSSLIYDDTTVEKFEVIEEIPDEARRVRRALKLDFGAIEYFPVGGDCFVVDANKTVTQPDAWIERFPSAGRYIDKITARLIELVEAGRA
jgi:hypothetical protein